MPEPLPLLLDRIRACELCAAHLPLGPRPVVVADARARLLIAGQAPGTRVHQTGIPWNDPSGERLREWLGLDRETFYDARKVALVPMGFCYPGRGRQGDLPPRPECAATWHPQLLPQLRAVELTLVIGRYAQRHHLGTTAPVTEVVRQWRNFLPEHIPLPHPSPRNTGWLQRHPWFEQELLPVLRAKVRELGLGRK